MFPQDVTTWIIYILVTVLLGALGSGFWEAVFKPVSVSAGRLLLKAVTLGMASARDAIYKDMATRPTFRPALFIVGIISITFTGFLGYSSSQYYRVYFDAPKNVQESRFNTKTNNLSLDELVKEEQRLSNRVKELEKEMALALFISSLFGFVVTTLVHARYRYFSTAISYFDQLMAICAPYVSSEEEKMFRSEFAQMTCHGDYVTIINKLRQKASEHGISRLPVFLAF